MIQLNLSFDDFFYLTNLKDLYGSRVTYANGSNLVFFDSFGLKLSACHVRDSQASTFTVEGSFDSMFEPGRVSHRKSKVDI